MDPQPLLQAELVSALRLVNAMDALSDRVLFELAGEMSTRVLEDQEVLVQQDDTVGSLCVVLSGALSPTWIDRSGVERALPDIPRGGLLGEVALLSDALALDTVRAQGRTCVAQLSRAAFERFAEQRPAEAFGVIEAVRPTIDRHALRFALRRVSAFEALDAHLLSDLEHELEPLSLYAGETLIRAGETRDGIYIVVTGRLRIVHRTGHDETRIAEVGPGETVGEMELVTGERPSADVYAVRDTRLARLSARAIERLLARHPRSTLLLLVRGPMARLRNGSNGVSAIAPITTITLVPAAADVPMDAFAGHLHQALAAIGTTLKVSSADVDARFGRSGAAQAFAPDGGGSGLLDWMAKQEVEYRYVLYQTDPGCTPWTERAIRQADHVVTVARADGTPHIGDIEREVLEGAGLRSKRTLALIHAPGASPDGTSRWLSVRPAIERHVHLHLEEPADFARLARMLTGNAVGLALGGGFARGLAHIGVLRAVEELNIPIDAIGGSSMGALIATQYLLGHTADQMVGLMTNAFARSFDDITIPFLAFKRGGKLSRAIHDLCQDIQIEDLWLPFFCTSSNLNRAELKVHSSGSLARAMLATTRAPGVLPPLVIDGELHVDGGVVNNVPVDVMKNFCNEGRVIGVDVSPPHELNQVVDYGHDVSGWEAIWRRFHPTREKRSYRPSILLVMVRLIEFGGISFRLKNAGQADVYIAPDVLRFKRTDFAAAGPLADAGYAASRTALSEWLARRTGSTADVMATTRRTERG